MTSKLFFGAVLGATLTMTLPALAHVTLELPEVSWQRGRAGTRSP